MRTTQLSHLGWALGALLMLGATGCLDETSSDAGNNTTADSGIRPDMGVRPDGGPTDQGVPDTGGNNATTIALNFCVDDSANQTYTAADGLAWKGSFKYTLATNKIERDPSWAGPFPMLFDDGPRSAGGHEPEGEEANDHVWCVSADLDIPTVETSFEYGAIWGSVNGANSDNWIWTGPNGTFTVAANQTTDVTAAPLVLPPFGTVDFRLTLDVNNLNPLSPPYDSTMPLSVKGSAWNWALVELHDDGMDGDETADDGLFTFVFSEHPVPHAGLLRVGDKPEFVFVYNGVEYKVAAAAATEGVAAAVNHNHGKGWIDVPIERQPDGDQNTFITVPDETFTPPAGHVEVSFSIDDTANASLTTADGLAWKGSFGYNPETRIMTRDPSWGGPFAMLSDDGAWTDGGHEASGAVAGDHIWSVAAWVETPTADTMFEYGAIRDSVNGSDGGWIWVGPNGMFTITANQTTATTVPGLVIAAFGDIDFRLTFEPANIDPSFTYAPGDTIELKSSAWAWSVQPAVDDGTGGDETSGDGIFSFVLGQNIGPGKPLPSTRLLNHGDQPEFIFVIHGVEYKANQEALTGGITTWVLIPPSTTWTSVPIAVMSPPGNGNTYIVVP